MFFKSIFLYVMKNSDTQRATNMQNVFFCSTLIVPMVNNFKNEQ